MRPILLTSGIAALIVGCAWPQRPVASVASAADTPQHRVHSLDVKVLSTMLADNDGIGEWGFSALVVADGHRILFDTGARPDTS